MAYNIKYSCITHIGNCRNINQDNFICEKKYRSIENDDMEYPLTGTVSPRAAAMLGIFDGMGGEECGEIAALIAAREASELTVGRDAVKAVSDYCTKTNEKICQYAAENAVSAMGTTAATLIFTEKEIVLCNIGDSKIFRIFDGEMEQISYDHVAISAYGTKPPLSQNLGIPPEELVIEPYISKGAYHDGDIYLICSDGLTDMVSVDEIKKVVIETDFDGIADKLLNEALSNGGKDNISIIICSVKQKNKRLLNMLKRRKEG